MLPHPILELQRKLRIDHPSSLLLVLYHIDNGRLMPLGRNERFGESHRVACNHVVGGLCEQWSKTKTDRQRIVNNRSLGQATPKSGQQVIGPRTAPLVNRLVVIADNHHIGMYPSNCLDEAFLSIIHVLVFVDNHDTQATDRPLPKIRMSLGNRKDDADKIVKTERTCLVPKLLKAGIDQRDVAACSVGSTLRTRWDESRLPQGNRRSDRIDVDRTFFDDSFTHERLQGPIHEDA